MIVTCPRCTGRMMGDPFEEMSCAACGHVIYPGWDVKAAEAAAEEDRRRNHAKQAARIATRQSKLAEKEAIE